MKISTFFDFCSGIGGGRLGLEEAGLSCVGYSDSARLAPITYTLMHDAENEINYGNLKRINSETLPKFDMLIAGFPCQTFSVIGRKEGFDDKRGQIIFHLIRILSETKPICFLLENVKGLVTHDKGQTLKTIISDLENAGYHVIYKVLSSLDYGVPQMRQRVYIIGFRKDVVDSTENFKWPIPKPHSPLTNYLVDNDLASDERIDILKKYLCNPTNQGKYSLDDLKTLEGKILDTRMNDLRIYDNKCPTLRAQRDGILYIRDHKIYQLTGYEALLLQGFPVEYAKKVKNKVSNRHLLMQAGNAMTVTVITAIAQSMQTFLLNIKERTKMTMEWEKFEQASTDYLNKRYNYYANFTSSGDHNSKVSDIIVSAKENNQCLFTIEAKKTPAQCGQFVTFPDFQTSSFYLSERNSDHVNFYTAEILNYMNDNFDTFCTPTTAGIPINMPNSEEIFSKWIIDHYKNLGVEYIITNDYTIFPLSEIRNYFYINACYRVKKSGSRQVPKKDVDIVSDYIKSHYPSITTIEFTNNHLYVASNENLKNEKFSVNENSYMFSEKDSNFEVRKLSNTNNPNVIFDVTLKDDIKGLSEEDFIKILKSQK